MGMVPPASAVLVRVPVDWGCCHPRVLLAAAVVGRLPRIWGGARLPGSVLSVCGGRWSGGRGAAILNRCLWPPCFLATRAYDAGGPSLGGGRSRSGCPSTAPLGGHLRQRPASWTARSGRPRCARRRWDNCGCGVHQCCKRKGEAGRGESDGSESMNNATRPSGITASVCLCA